MRLWRRFGWCNPNGDVPVTVPLPSWGWRRCHVPHGFPLGAHAKRHSLLATFQPIPIDGVRKMRSLWWTSTMIISEQERRCCGYRSCHEGVSLQYFYQLVRLVLRRRKLEYKWKVFDCFQWWSCTHWPLFKFYYSLGFKARNCNWDLCHCVKQTHAAFCFIFFVPHQCLADCFSCVQPGLIHLSLSIEIKVEIQSNYGLAQGLNGCQQGRNHPWTNTRQASDFKRSFH